MTLRYEQVDHFVSENKDDEPKRCNGKHLTPESIIQPGDKYLKIFRMGTGYRLCSKCGTEHVESLIDQNIKELEQFRGFVKDLK